MVAIVSVALFAACTDVTLRPGGDDDDDDDGSGGGPGPAPLTVRAPLAFDPLRSPLDLDGTAPDGAAVALELIGDDGIAAWTGEALADDDGVWSVSWDGRRGDGWARAGGYTLRATAGDQANEADVALVRLGFVQAHLEDDDGLTALREPLYWPVARELQDEGEPVSTVPAIDDGVVPLDFPAVPPGPMAVRPASGEPVAYVFDGRPILALTLPEAAGDGGPTGLDAVDVAVEVDGWTVLDGGPLRPSGTVVLQRDEPLGDSVGVSAWDLELRFVAGEDALGSQRLPVRLYRVADVSAFDEPAARYRPWAPVLEQALVAIDGAPAAPEPVVDALVDFVFEDLGLVYDTTSGASAYSTYGSWSFADPHFLLSDFLVRRFGNVINCSDAGNILGAYANMVGVRLDHVIISPSFDLNYIRAIGTTEHTRCPFGSFGCSFSYHAVTTIPGTDHVWDATLALDGDGDPRNAPSVDLMVRDLSGEQYLEGLVRAGSPQFEEQGQETLQ